MTYLFTKITYTALTTLPFAMAMSSPQNSQVPAQNAKKESQYFVNGIFPNVSSTGNWYDVGHYTQIIWLNTAAVGCGVTRSGGKDILVCRYSHPGNYRGQKVY